jgi:hypothetical protein
VRWTEGRNLEDVLRQIASGALRVRPADRRDARRRGRLGRLRVARLGEPPRSASCSTTTSTRPSRRPPAVSYRPIRRAASPPKAGAFGVGVVGYGGYFRSMLLPL